MKTTTFKSKQTTQLGKDHVALLIYICTFINQFTDQCARNKFYYNKKTGKTGWTRAEVTPDEIVQQKDPTTGKIFWTNKTTNKKAWSREEVETRDDDGDDGDEDEDVADAVGNAMQRASVTLTNFAASVGLTSADGSAQSMEGSGPKSTDLQKLAPSEASEVAIDADFYKDPSTGRRLRIKGALMKKGGYRRNWQKRWFTLNIGAGEFSYYSGEERLPKQLKGTIRLGPASSFAVPDFKAGMFKHDKNATAESACNFELLMITEADGKPRSKFCARAESAAILKEWKDSIETSIDSRLSQSAKKIDIQMERVNAKFEQPVANGSDSKQSTKAVSSALSSTNKVASTTSTPRTVNQSTTSSNHQPRSPETGEMSTDPIKKKYEMMLKVGLPRGAIENKMRADGVDPGILFSAISSEGNKNKQASNTETATTADTNDPRAKKYQMMLKVGLPRGAVENKMIADGVDPAILFPSTPADESTNLRTSKASKDVTVPSEPRGGLLAEIQAKKQLKKTTTSTGGNSPVGVGKPMSLLDEIKAKKALKKTQQSGTGGGGTEAPHKPMSLLDEIKAKKALKKTGGPGSGTATGNSATPIQTANTEGLSLMEQIKLKQQAKKKGGIDLSKLP